MSPFSLSVSLSSPESSPSPSGVGSGNGSGIRIGKGVKTGTSCVQIGKSSGIVDIRLKAERKRTRLMRRVPIILEPR